MIKIEDIESEIKAFNQIKSPQVVKVLEMEREGDFLYIVSEHVNGKSLSQCLENHGQVNEKIARTWFKKIVEGVSSIHDGKIVHKDITLDNIYIKTKKENGSEVIDAIKIVDFGFGIRSDQKTKCIPGTQYQLSPEVLSKNAFSAKHDVWTLGVVLQVVLTGNFPFKGSDNNALFKSIRHDDPNVHSVPAGNEVKNLLTSMLEKDIKKRITCSQAIAHEWFNGEVDPFADLSTGNNKSAVAAVISNHTTSHSLNLAICTFQTRMCNNIDAMKKVKSFIADADKDKKLERSDLNTLCGKLADKAGNDDIDDISEAFKAAGGIKGGELIESLKLSYRENNFALAEFIFAHMIATYGNVNVDQLKKFIKDAELSQFDVSKEAVLDMVNKKTDNITVDEFKEGLLKLLE